MKTKNLKIETLSPVFIWKGDDYSKFDYTTKIIKHNGRSNLEIRIYDINKLIGDLDKYFNEDEIFGILDDIEEIMEGNDSNSDIISYLKGKNKNIPFNEYKISKYSTPIMDFTHKKDIKTFINQKSIPHVPYLPGSSVKGAINTALLYGALKEYDDKELKNIIKSGSLQPNRGGAPNISNGENRYIISDADIKTNMLDIFKAQGFYVYYKGNAKNMWKWGNFNNRATNYVEGLKPNQIIDLKIKCSEEMFNKIKNECNELSLKICEWELKLLEKYCNRRLRQVYFNLMDFYEDLGQDIITSNNVFFLNIGWGGGYLPKTIYLLAEEKNIEFNAIKRKLNTKDHYKKNINNYEEFPFTRTITRYYSPKKRGLVNYPFGWVKIEG